MFLFEVKRLIWSAVKIEFFELYFLQPVLGGHPSLLLRRFVFRMAECEPGTSDWWWTARDHGKGGGHPVLSGHLAISQGGSLNTSSTVLNKNETIINAGYWVLSENRKN